MSEMPDVIWVYERPDSSQLARTWWDNIADAALYRTSKYHHDRIVQAKDARIAELEAQLKEREGWVMVPVEPTEEMWSGLARSLMMGRDLNCFKAGAMMNHLNSSGAELIPSIESELSNPDAHLSKGDMCVLIYKAMIASRPNASTEGV